MPAHKGNKYASKSKSNLKKNIALYIQHIANGFSKKSFIECDYRTIESHLESDKVLFPLKKEIEKAERIGRAEWERIGKDLTTGKLKSNPATWIFTMKNKYSDEWADKTEVDHNINIPSLPTVIIKSRNHGD